MNEKAIPKEVQNILTDHLSLLALRDFCAKLPFGYRKARKAAIDAGRKADEFWEKVKEIYPETKDGQWFYNHGKLIRFVVPIFRRC